MSASSMAGNEAGSFASHKLPLEKLTVEIIQKILCEITDLDTLYNLIRVSPVSSRIFDYMPHQIIEEVLPRCPLKIEMQHLLRAVILTRSSALPFNSLHDFKTLFRKQLILASRRFSGPPITLPSDSLEAASPESIRSGLATACHISALTYGCLEFYLERLRDTIIYDCRDEEFDLDDFVQNPAHAWTRSVEQPIELAAYCGPPSWVEEMRVARTLWKMQLVGEVQLLARRDLNGLGWPAEDIEKLASEKFQTSLWKWCEDMEEEAKTVCEYLQSLDDEDGKSSQRQSAAYYRLPRPKTIKTRNWTTQMPRPEKRRILDDMFYDLGNRLVPAKPPIESLELLIQKPLLGEPLDYENSNCGQRPSDADELNDGASFYQYLGSDSKSPLFGVKSAVFRPLGIALWDGVRLEWMGLATETPYFAWRSLVPEKELAEAADRIKKQTTARDVRVRLFGHGFDGF